MNRYPDMGSAALYAALADALRRAGRGPAAGDRVGGADLPARPGVLRPRRRGRLRVALLRGLPDRGHRRGGATSVQVPVTADGRHDLDAMVAAITDRTKVVLVCTPNNPTGPAVTQTELDALPRQGAARTCWSSSTRRTSSSCGWTTRSTASRRTARHDNVVLTRTFSKAYGLGGLPGRVRRRARADRRRAARGLAAVRRQPRRAGRGDRVAGRRGRAARAGRGAGRASAPGLVARLREAGWELPEAQGNFVWFALGDRTADFAAAADEVGIVGAAVRRRRRPGHHRRGRGQRPVVEVASRFARRHVGQRQCREPGGSAPRPIGARVRSPTMLLRRRSPLLVASLLLVGSSAVMSSSAHALEPLPGRLLAARPVLRIGCSPAGPRSTTGPRGRCGGR